MPARFTLPILAAAAFVSWSAFASPAEAPASDFEYKRDGKNVTLTKYTGNASELVIPEKIDGCPVTEIRCGLGGTKTLIRVSIPDTVTRIGNAIFFRSSNLESVRMSENIESIGYGCFDGCGKLKEISFPKRISVEGPSAFLSCNLLGTFITGDGVQLLRIGTDMREYTVPASIREVAPSAFQQTQVERVAFKEGTIRIGGAAFRQCSNLESVTLPQTLEDIGGTAFSACPSLTSVIFMGDCPKTEKDLFKDSPDVTVYYNLSAKGWKPDANGKWAKYGVPLRPLDPAKITQKPAAPAAVAAPTAAPAPQVAPPPPVDAAAAAEFDALYAEKFPEFPPALQKLHTIFTNETTKIDLDRVRGHAAALGDYATNLDKLPAFYAQKADLAGVKAAKAAKELSYRGEVDTSGARPELVALTAAYTKRCAASDAKAADALAALTGKYINALNGSLRDLLMKNDIQTAELYQLEIDAAERVRSANQAGQKQ